MREMSFIIFPAVNALIFEFFLVICDCSRVPRLSMCTKFLLINGRLFKMLQVNSDRQNLPQIGPARLIYP